MLRFFCCALPALLTAEAVARPSTFAMTCGQAQALVASNGAIVMNTGRNTYARFVANPGYCETAEWAYWTTAPTIDTAQCQLGYVCNTVPPLEYDRPGDHWLFDR